jgi:hypothetical protein
VTDYGCDFCADAQNRHYGHLERLAVDEDAGTILLRCPLCSSLYLDTGWEAEQVRLTPDEARERFPGSA